MSHKVLVSCIKKHFTRVHTYTMIPYQAPSPHSKGREMPAEFITTVQNNYLRDGQCSPNHSMQADSPLNTTIMGLGNISVEMGNTDITNRAHPKGLRFRTILV